jgi:predicted XRE-type DNA-binding protein
MNNKKISELIDLAVNDFASINEEIQKRAFELTHEIKALAVQNEVKDKQIANLISANNELVNQIMENEKRAAELEIAIRELALQKDKMCE